MADVEGLFSISLRFLLLFMAFFAIVIVLMQIRPEERWMRYYERNFSLGIYFPQWLKWSLVVSASATIAALAESTLAKFVPSSTMIVFTTLRFLGGAFLLALLRVYSRDRITWEIALSVAFAVTVCFTVLHWIEYRCSNDRIVAFLTGIAAYASGACSALLLHYWIVNY